MDISYKFQKGINGVVVKLRGTYCIEEFEEFYRKLISEVMEKPINAIIWDARKLDVKDISQDQIRQIISKIGQWSSKRKGGKAAWVVGDALGFGLGRMFEMGSDGVLDMEIKIFKNLAKAKKLVE
jgi:hypothetical protein